MSLKYDENNDPEYLESDLVQTIETLEKKLKLTIMALRDISIWPEELTYAQSVANWALSQLDDWDK